MYNGFPVMRRWKRQPRTGQNEKPNPGDVHVMAHGSYRVTTAFYKHHTAATDS